MKKEIIEFKDIVVDLYAISESHNFSDEMRNKASELQYYINKAVGNIEPIIKKSGETFALRNSGIDYLFIGYDVSDINLIRELFNSYNKEENDLFKPISEIKINDNIAKLRPMVMCQDMPGSEELEKLIYVSNIPEYPYVVEDLQGYAFCRIATVADMDK